MTTRCMACGRPVRKAGFVGLNGNYCGAECRSMEKRGVTSQRLGSRHMKPDRGHGNEKNKAPERPKGLEIDVREWALPGARCVTSRSTYKELFCDADVDRLWGSYLE